MNLRSLQCAETSGITLKVYATYDYAKAKRSALDLWALGERGSSLRSKSPRSFVQICNCLSRLPEKLRQGAAFRLSLLRMKPGRRRSSATSSMKPANGPAPHRGSHARVLRPLRGCRAPKRLLEGILPFHEDCPVLSEPLPPCPTLPTIACPPSFTVGWKAAAHGNLFSLNTSRHG